MFFDFYGFIAYSYLTIIKVYKSRNHKLTITLNKPKVPNENEKKLKAHLHELRSSFNKLTKDTL